jgi:hypothetical protein
MALRAMPGAQIKSPSGRSRKGFVLWMNGLQQQ